MISGILDRLHAFLKRKPSRFPPDESEVGMTTEEHAALVKALNPEYRVYVRHHGVAASVLIDEGRVPGAVWASTDLARSS